MDDRKVKGGSSEFSYLRNHFRMHFWNRSNFTPASGRQWLVPCPWFLVVAYVGFVVEHTYSGSSMCVGVSVVVTEAGMNRLPPNKPIRKHREQRYTFNPCKRKKFEYN